MLETPEELARLQSLLDASHARATDHLRGIIHDDRTLSAVQVVALLPGDEGRLGRHGDGPRRATDQRHGRPLPPRHVDLLHEPYRRQGAPSRGPAGRVRRPRRWRAARGLQPRAGGRDRGRRARRRSTATGPPTTARRRCRGATWSCIASTRAGWSATPGSATSCSPTEASASEPHGVLPPEASLRHAHGAGAMDTRAPTRARRTAGLRRGARRRRPRRFPPGARRRDRRDGLLRAVGFPDHARDRRNA